MSGSPTFDHEVFQSPFTWRYGSHEMRALWSEAAKRRLWRRIWVAMAEAQMGAGIVTGEQVADLRAHVDDVDLARAHALEEELRHDLMAEVHTYAEQCPVGGGVIHLGATSMDIEDNADALRLLASMGILLDRVDEATRVLVDKVEQWADAPTMAFTHLQPAEPTTIGYRLAQHLQDLATDRRELIRVHGSIRGKGMKGAAGTSASYAQLFAGTAMTHRAFEDAVMAALVLRAFPVTTQTYPRKQDLLVITALSSLGQTLYKLAFDVRLLQSPVIGEWSEPFGARQVGSSAMPFKRNPIVAENVDSLARHLAALPRVAWDNAAHSLLERTLDDSANRRSVLPEAFLIADELLLRAAKLIGGLVVDTRASARLLASYGTFAATERLLMELARRGCDRQQMHEVIREQSLAAWAELREGKPSTLAERLARDERIAAHARHGEVIAWLDPTGYVGDAPGRARELAAEIRAELDGAGGASC